MSTHDPQRRHVAAEQHAREAWKRLPVEARRRDVVLYRTEAADGTVHFFTERRGRDLQRHDSEEQLRLYLRGAK